MKRLLPALLALLLLLTACGGSAGGNKGDMPTDDMAMDSAATESAPDYGWEMAPMEPEMPAEAPAVPEPEAQTNGTQDTLPANAKLIYSADLTLETKSFDEATRALDKIVKDLGGYYENHSLDQGSSYRSLSCTIRVPAENFQALLEQAGALAHATSCYQDTENVSEAYYDTEARLQTQETKRDRLLALLETAATMEDIISLETALSETELQIEYLTGSLRRYDSLIGYSTVRLNLYEVYKLATDEIVPETFGQRLASAFSTGFRRGVDGLEDFVIALARNWVGVLAFAAVVSVVMVLFRRKRRREKAALAASKSDDPKT